MMWGGKGKCPLRLHMMHKYTTSRIPQKELGVGGVAMVFEIEANVANDVVAFSGWVVGGRPARCAHADTHEQMQDHVFLSLVHTNRLGAHLLVCTCAHMHTCMQN